MTTKRIVAVGDTHVYHNKYSVPDGDIFIHVGDMCAHGSLWELQSSAEWIMGLPHEHKVIVAGNHDWPFVVDKPEATSLFDGAVYLQDAAATVAGVKFYGSPWQPEFFNWAFNLPRDGVGLRKIWGRIPTGLDILITHGPPHRYGDRCWDGNRAGCELLLERIRIVKPKLHLFGHIHDDGGTWNIGPTTLANVTTAECNRAPTVIDFDPEKPESVTLVHVPPARQARK